MNQERRPDGPRRGEQPPEGLLEPDVLDSPYLQVRAWVDEAVSLAGQRPDVPEPLAMSVATVDGDGAPNVRTVLMRFLDERGPGFVTNLESTKSRELRGRARVAAGLTWPSLFRAIRFRGRAELIERTDIGRYFASRPYGSRLSAWASEQSRPIADREALERRWAEVLARFPETGEPDEVPLPGFWGGWRVVPDEVEFWAGRSDRLHDRIVFTRNAAGSLADPGSWTRWRRQP
jgi:pyridoxamine 5'-phosphate oxidase